MVKLGQAPISRAAEPRDRAERRSSLATRRMAEAELRDAYICAVCEGMAMVRGAKVKHGELGIAKDRHGMKTRSKGKAMISKAMAKRGIAEKSEYQQWKSEEWRTQCTQGNG